MNLNLSPQLRNALLIGILLLVGLRLLATLPQDAPRAAERAPMVDRSINIGSKNDVCIGWCPK